MFPVKAIKKVLPSDEDYQYKVRKEYRHHNILHIFDAKNRSTFK